MTPRLLLSIEVPQADSLAGVRRVLQALSEGIVARERLSEQSGLSVRHVGYAITAARLLGFVGAAADDGDRDAITAAGRELLATAPGSNEERACFRRAIAGCEPIRQIAPDLLDLKPSTREVIARRIFRTTAGIGKETARRRAQTLLAWRSQVLAVQLPLFPKPRKKRSVDPS